MKDKAKNKANRVNVVVAGFSYSLYNEDGSFYKNYRSVENLIKHLNNNNILLANAKKVFTEIITNRLKLRI